MKLSLKQTFAMALLAGSTLSVVPAVAQTQAPASGQDGGSTVLPRKLPPGSDGAAGGKQAQPKQDMGATAQQPQGAAGGNGSTTAQGKADDQPRLKKGDTAAQEKPADPKKAQAKDSLPAAKDSTAQQKPAGQNDGSTTANSGSGTDARKPATDDTARQNNGAQQPGSNQAATNKPSSETTGSINISTEQKTEVRKILVQNKVEPAKVDVEVNVGVAIPRTVRLHPLPPRIVEIVPAYRGYEYFVLADGRIIIVEPSSHKIVYILVG